MILKIKASDGPVYRARFTIFSRWLETILEAGEILSILKMNSMTANIKGFARVRGSVTHGNRSSPN